MPFARFPECFSVCVLSGTLAEFNAPDSSEALSVVLQENMVMAKKTANKNKDIFFIHCRLLHFLFCTHVISGAKKQICFIQYKIPAKN
jgi:hypothetical protein